MTASGPCAERSTGGRGLNHHHAAIECGRWQSQPHTLWSSSRWHAHERLQQFIGEDFSRCKVRVRKRLGLKGHFTPALGGQPLDELLLHIAQYAMMRGALADDSQALPRQIARVNLEVRRHPIALRTIDVLAEIGDIRAHAHREIDMRDAGIEPLTEQAHADQAIIGGQFGRRHGLLAEENDRGTATVCLHHTAGSFGAFALTFGNHHRRGKVGLDRPQRRDMHGAHRIPHRLAEALGGEHWRVVDVGHQHVVHRVQLACGDGCERVLALVGLQAPQIIAAVDLVVGRDIAGGVGVGSPEELRRLRAGGGIRIRLPVVLRTQISRHGWWQGATDNAMTGQ